VPENVLVFEAAFENEPFWPLTTDHWPVPLDGNSAARVTIEPGTFNWSGPALAWLGCGLQGCVPPSFLMQRAGLPHSFESKVRETPVLFSLIVRIQKLVPLSVDVE
jgi:hypothetical protein